MTVLNTIELMTFHPVIEGLFAICIVALGLSFVGIILTPIEHDTVGGILCVIALVSLAGSIITGLCLDKNMVPSGKVQYEVIFDEGASFMDVIDKYDVIEQRGDIFVLEDKKDDRYE